jgi:hypothetical protein
LYLRQGLKFDIQRDTPLRQSTEFSRKGVPWSRSPPCDGWVPGPARETTGGKLTPACFVQICYQ